MQNNDSFSSTETIIPDNLKKQKQKRWTEEQTDAWMYNSDTPYILGEYLDLPKLADLLDEQNWPEPPKPKTTFAEWKTKVWGDKFIDFSIRASYLWEYRKQLLETYVKPKHTPET